MRNLSVILFVSSMVVSCMRVNTPPIEKVVKATSYDRKCSVFAKIPPVSPEKREILFLGHSLINEFLVDEFIPHGDSIVFTNMGIGGDDTRGVYKRRNLAFDRTPSTIIIEIGINDLINAEPLDTVKYYYGMLLEDAHRRGQTMIVCAVIPNRKEFNNQIVDLNSFLKKKTTVLHYRYIDMYTPFLQNKELAPLYDCGDKTHLTGDGYVLWADSLKKYI